METTLRRPEDHNPDYWILELKIDNDSFITCAESIKTGECKMEYYVGENYVVGSKKKSYSRVYPESEIPTKWVPKFTLLKAMLKDLK